jgi:tRNA threonylcarbamoyladenosine biosynthesis protein TsaB
VVVDSEGHATLLASRLCEQPRALSQQLFGALQHTLNEAGWTLDEVDALAVGLGPGSWTGLRIGLSAAKTLAQTRGWNLVGVPTFRALAQAVWNTCAKTSTLLLVASPCRPGGIYAEIYQAANKSLSATRNAWIGAPDHICATLIDEASVRGAEAPFVLTGDAASVVGEYLEVAGQPHCIIAAKLEDVLLEIARTGAVKVANSKDDGALTLQPLYLAPSNAERNLLAR